MRGVTVVVWFIVLAWVVPGAVALAVMRRRGHDPFAWGLLFVVLGPLALPLAVSADRHRPPEPGDGPHEGELDVLVAHDGSPDAAAALDAALQLLGGRMTSLTLAAVVDIEAATTVRGRDTCHQAQERLDAVAAGVRATVGAPVETVVLFGDPGHVLQHYAAEHGYELIVTGCGPARSTHLVRGRAARSVTTASPVPVFVGPPAR